MSLTAYNQHMPEARLDYQPLEDETLFEDFCLKLLRIHWNCPTLELYARRGYKQFGIDIIDLGGESKLRAAQCKCLEPLKPIPPKIIEDEVSKAKQFTPSLDFYAILTTAKISPPSQHTILGINKQHTREGLFRVELLAWDQINRLLNQYPQVADEFYSRTGSRSNELILEQLSEVQVSIESIAAEKSTGSIDSELDEAKQCVEHREFQRARLILNRLRDRKWDQLSARQKFRLLSNTAASHLGENEEQKAARLFLDAKKWQPDDERACANEARAYQLLKDSDRAFKLAAAYRRQFPNSVRIAAIWIHNAPTGFSYESVEKDIPEIFLDDSEVSVALAHRAGRDRDYESAIRLAEKTIKNKPDWSYPHLLVAKIILEKHGSETLATFGQMFYTSNDVHLHKAQTACSRAISLAESGEDKHLQAEALLTRGLVREIMDDKVRSEEDIREAYRLNPHNQRVIYNFAIILVRKDDINEAIRLLREAIAMTDEDHTFFLLAAALAKRMGPGDEEEASKLLVNGAKSARPMQPGFREEVIDRAMNLLVKGQRWEEVQLMLDEIPDGSISAVYHATLEAHLYLRQGKQEEAFDSANDALTAVSGNTSRHDKRRLARILSESGRWKDSLTLWESLAIPTRDSSDVRNLLKCADRLGYHDIILRTCQSLREAGVWDRELLDLEISILERYDADSAIKLLQQHIRDYPDDKVMRLRLSVIGQRLGLPDLVISDPTNVPRIQDVAPHVGRTVVGVLKRAGHPNDALRYAYELLRCNYSSVEAHSAYLFAMNPFEPKPDMNAPDAVQAGTAVRYTERSEDTPHWVVVEDSPNPDESRDEIAPDHHLAKQLIGKRIGEEFIIAKGRVSNRTGVVEDIQPKYVFCYRRCLNEWQLRFPDVSGVEVVHFKTTDKSGDNSACDFSPLLKDLDRRQEKKEKLMDIWRSSPISVHIFGEKFGISAFEAMVSLAASDDMIRCCLGDAEETNEAQKALFDANTIVIDLTALATLAMLGRIHLLAKFSKRIVLSQSTMGELLQIIETESIITGKSTMLSKVGEKYALFEETPEERKKRI